MRSNEIIPLAIQKSVNGNAGASDLQQTKSLAKQGLCKHKLDAASCKDEDAGEASDRFLNHEVYYQFSGSRWLQTEVQTIEGEIAHCPISQKKYQLLCKKLHSASQKLQDMEKTTDVFAKAQAEYLKEKVVALSRDLVDRLVEGEVTQIQQESSSIRQGKITAKAVKLLETHIHQLEDNHKTSIPHRRIIADAKHALLEAKAKLDGKPAIKHFDWLATQVHTNNLKNREFDNGGALNLSQALPPRKQPNLNKLGDGRGLKVSGCPTQSKTDSLGCLCVRKIEEVELLPGDVEELFDIARAVYNRDFRQAKMRYHTLSHDYQRHFEKHMQQLMAVPFDDALETIQALIATANELVENGESYPTSLEIDQLFLGLSQVNEEERIDDRAEEN